METDRKVFLGQSCKMTVVINGKSLFYTVKKVLDISSDHITFVDKFDEKYRYALEYVKEIRTLSPKLKKK